MRGKESCRIKGKIKEKVKGNVKGNVNSVIASILIAALLLPGTIPVFADDIASGFYFEDLDEDLDEMTFHYHEDRQEDEPASDSIAGEKVKSSELGKTAGSGRMGAATGSSALPASGSGIEEEIRRPVQPATPASALMSVKQVSALGDLWNDWNADFSFLDGSSGAGTKERPFQIRNKNQLMGLSQLAAMGMRIDPGEGDTEIIGSYEGAYFKLMSSIDLGGMDWNPIGFYQDSSEMTGAISHPFCGRFDGNGKTISNFRLSQTTWNHVGVFGALENAVVENLTVKPGKSVYGRNNVSLLAGSAAESVIRNCAVTGDISAAGNAGGICAEISGPCSTIENCKASVTIDAAGGAEIYAGGIAGKAADVNIADCEVTTGDNRTARIQGKGIIGGIVGFQNDTNIYNSYVSGTIGGTGTQAAGGITGRYGSGHLKVARFEGTIGDSGLGSAGRRGSFIGTREAGDYFRYGEDVAYLFTDTEAGIAYNVCGSGISDDNTYTYAAHIGYSHRGDLSYSLVQGGVSKDMTDTYYYEELENGILDIMERDNGGAGSEELGYELDHFAPNDAGRPTRGYLITIPQIDTVSSGTNYYDVAVLKAKGSSGYYREIDKENRGAVAAGMTVTVSTSPKHTAEAKFQMEGVPTYTIGQTEHETSYISGGGYSFTMPPENTEVKAVYKKVAVRVSVIPGSYGISVIEERTGNRKQPVRTTRVLNNEGKLIAAYINGTLEQGTQVQPVTLQAVVDTNNDVEDRSVKWSVDDPDLIELLRNEDEDASGYTEKSASVRVNLGASFFTETIRKLEEIQAVGNYQYPIPDTIYGAGHQSGGVAILTASTKPAASFEGKPCTANSRLNVTFQIKDKTYVANECASLDRSSLEFVITRKLTGNRKQPEEAILVTPPQTLSAAFSPDYFDKKDITWKADDPDLIAVNGENKSAGVAVRPDAKWIRNIIASDQGIHDNDPYAVLNGSGSRTAKVTVIADDMLGNRQTAECQAALRFVTEDQTRVYAEGVKAAPQELTYQITCAKSGNRNSPSIAWTGIESKNVTAEVLPAQAFDKSVKWYVSDDALEIESSEIDSSGILTINTGAEWIREADRVYPYKASHTSTITAETADGGFKTAMTVLLTYEMTDNTYSTGSSSHSSGGGGGGGGIGSSGGGYSSGVGPAGGVGPGADSAAAPAGSITGTWVNTADGLWAFTSGGRTYLEEWAYIHNPYAEKGQSSTDWFRFDGTGHMMAGWFYDLDGNAYYLWPVSDGTRGHMVTGWQWIAGDDGKSRCYYFNPVSDGTRGILYRNAVTPDGKTVNEKGEWTIDGVIQIK